MKFLRSLSLTLAIAFFMGAVVPQGAQASEMKYVGNAFEKFHYAMNVEWDQQDPAFMMQAEQELSDALKNVDAETLQKYTANSFTDTKTREEFLTLMKAIKAQDLSKAQAVAVAANWAKNLHNGLSFNGDGPHFPRGGNGHMMTIVVVVVVVIVVCHMMSHMGGGHHDRD